MRERVGQMGGDGTGNRKSEAGQTKGEEWKGNTQRERRRRKREKTRG
jgi:hypothetical protein